MNHARRRKISLILMGIIFCLLILTMLACGASAGEVYQKQYHEGYYETYWEDDYIYLPDGNGGLKQTWVGSHQEKRWVEECYEPKFRNDSGDEGDTCVSKETYNQTEVGDWYEK